MAVSATVVYEVRSTATAANANGGGFKPGASGVDYSQQDAAQYNLTSLTSAAANAIILTASAATDMVGNIIHVISGTNVTPGWYEITAVSAGVSITVDRNWCTAAAAAGVANVGGALSLGSATANQTDSNFFATGLVAGNTVWIKSGTYVLGQTLSSPIAGTSSAPILVMGYNSARGDDPKTTGRPVFNNAASVMTFGPFTSVKYLIATGTGTSVLSGSVNGGNKFWYCKATNTSTTANRNAFNLNDDWGLVAFCEAISYRGRGVAIASSQQFDDGKVIGCYIHDCDVGVSCGGEGGDIIGNLIIACRTTGIAVTGGSNNATSIMNNTIYGRPSKNGSGITAASGTYGLYIINNIITGWATGISSTSFDWKTSDFNCLFGNTSNYSGFTDGPNASTVDPTFTGVSEINGSGGSFATTTFTDATKNFSAVVPGQDFLLVLSGTGATAGIYGITGVTSTTLTTDISIGTSGSSTVYSVITGGRNFQIGTNLKGLGFPGVFPGGLTQGYMDIGAVQRQEAGGGGSGMLYTPGMEGLG